MTDNPERPHKKMRFNASPTLEDSLCDTIAEPSASKAEMQSSLGDTECLTEGQPTMTTFMTLPSELRIHIYSYLFHGITLRAITLLPFERKPLICKLAILCTNRQCHDEVELVLWRNAVLEIDQGLCFNDWLYQRYRRHLNKLTEIRIDLSDLKHWKGLLVRTFFPGLKRFIVRGLRIELPESAGHVFKQACEIEEKGFDKLALEKMQEKDMADDLTIFRNHAKPSANYDTIMLVTFLRTTNQTLATGLCRFDGEKLVFDEAEWCIDKESDIWKVWDYRSKVTKIWGHEDMPYFSSLE